MENERWTVNMVATKKGNVENHKAIVSVNGSVNFIV
jgi:hypothetical protein